MINISLRKIYGLSCFLIVIVLCAGLWNIIVVWEGLSLPSKISSTASLVFQGLFFFLFYHLYKTSPKEPTPEEKSKEEEIDKFMENIK